LICKPNNSYLTAILFNAYKEWNSKQSKNGDKVSDQISKDEFSLIQLQFQNERTSKNRVLNKAGTLILCLLSFSQKLKAPSNPAVAKV